MSRKARLAAIAVAMVACIAAMIGLALGRGTVATASALPTVEVNLLAGGYQQLFLPRRAGSPDVELPVVWRASDLPTAKSPEIKAKASLRGFSAWHHGRSKPSLRLEQKDDGFVELSRPEDPLALCNWLPDQLAASLGLLHEHSSHIRLLLDGSDRGVYLRSLRPADDLCAAAGRARGTFWKGDALGERQHLDLWASRDSWRAAGADSPRARDALDELLAALREPASPESWQRMAGAFDVEAAARAAAIAVLVGSIHADRVHNHVLFFDPTRDRLEPLLWDANGFGIHAEPSLAVDVARHPLADRLLCSPRFVHRRNELLWELMQGNGSADALIATAERLLTMQEPALRTDPEIARLVLRRGVFEVEPLTFGDLPAAFCEFTTFVRQRDAHLRGYFAAGKAHIEPVPGHPDRATVTVAGHVAVRVTRDDGAPVQTLAGSDASLLWPGLSKTLTDVPQRPSRDFRGVSAPFASPSPLTYVVDSPPGRLRVHNPFTGAAIDTRSTLAAAAAAATAAATRSLHPFDLTLQSGAVHLGPGDVVLTEPMEVPVGASLHIAPNTRLALRPGAGIRCFGKLHMQGTAQAPIDIVCAENSRGIVCMGSETHCSHVTFTDQTPWRTQLGGSDVLLALHGADATLRHCRFARASGIAIQALGGRAHIVDTIVQRCHGTALLAGANAEVLAEHTEILFARHAVTARDGASVILRLCELRGNLTGVRAEHSARPFPGGEILLDRVTCSDNGQCDADADEAGVVRLVATMARVHPLARHRVHHEATGLATEPAAPR